jgi:hypothetical protein
MKKTSIATICSFALTLGCLITYNIIGSHLDSSGLLIEPFFLIPLGWFFFLSGVTLTIMVIAKRINSKDGPDKLKVNK